MGFSTEGMGQGKVRLARAWLSQSAVARSGQESPQLLKEGGVRAALLAGGTSEGPALGRASRGASQHIRIAKDFFEETHLEARFESWGGVPQNPSLCDQRGVLRMGKGDRGRFVGPLLVAL